MEEKYCTAVVLIAGRGNHMGEETVKQYMKIGGEPLVAYALEVFGASSVIDKIILMIDVGHMECVRVEIVETYGLKKVSTTGAGGDERYESIWKALCTLMGREKEERGSTVRNKQDGYAFVYDGARPFVTGEIIERAYRAVCGYNAYVAGTPIKDTIKLMSQEGMTESNLDRSMVWQVQTPQVFSVPLITEVFVHQMKADCVGITDDTMVVEAQIGVRTQVVMSSHANIKTTTPEGLFMVEVLRNSAV